MHQLVVSLPDKKVSMFTRNSKIVYNESTPVIAQKEGIEIRQEGKKKNFVASMLAVQPNRLFEDPHTIARKTWLRVIPRFVRCAWHNGRIRQRLAAVITENTHVLSPDKFDSPTSPYI